MHILPGNASCHAFLYPGPGGSMQDLSTLGGANESQAYGINASGQVVGFAFLAGNQSERAFLYTDGQMQDLNALTDLPNGVSLLVASGINDQGWIVGTTSSNHAFLLTPNAVPLPPSVLLLGSGLMGLCLLGRRWSLKK
jgi:probable HAF family extracellular repeat protein